jgi:RNase P protein component
MTDTQTRQIRTLTDANERLTALLATQRVIIVNQQSVINRHQEEVEQQLRQVDEQHAQLRATMEAEEVAAAARFAELMAGHAQ